jgi:hypothetical protein
MKLRFLIAALCLVPAICAAKLTDYEARVVKSLAGSGVEQNVAKLYEDSRTHELSKEEREFLDVTEMGYEQLEAFGCALPILRGFGEFQEATDRLAASPHAQAFLDDARHQLGEETWNEKIARAGSQQEMVFLAAQAMTAPMDESTIEGGRKARTRTLTMFFYWFTLTDGKCNASPEFRRHIGKPAA